VRIAITGVTGSLGAALLLELERRGGASRIVGVSRDEVKSGDLDERWGACLPQLRCQLGDVRDAERMEELFRGCDVVVHAAALKRVGHSVYSPGEVLKTNVLGTMAVVRAATEAGVGRVVVVSSDKAVEPTNLYGVSKAAAETYAVQANSYSLPRGTRVSCVRYGNVLGSRGSVPHVWRAQLARGEAPTVTDWRMTRFIVELRDAAAFVLGALDAMEGGEVFVPLLPAAKLRTLLRAVAREWRDRPTSADSMRWFADASMVETRAVVTGLRPGGEKLHESLLSREEPGRAWLDSGRGRVVVLPTHHSWRAAYDTAGFDPVGQAYTSDAPVRWLGEDELVEMLGRVP